MQVSEGLYSKLVATCIFDAFLSYTAIVLNVLTIQALRRTSSLPTPLKTLLLSLTVSDFGVGLLVQPLYAAILVMQIEENTENNLYYALRIAHSIQGNLLAFASFFGVVALTADRFLAIHFHLRYQELVTQKRVVAVVFLLWVLSAFLSITCVELDSRKGFIRYVCNDRRFLYHNFRIALLQNIRSRTTPHKSNSRLTSSREQRHGKCSKIKKNCN